MKVIVAGYNIDCENYEEIKTPETITAAYARISREDKPVNELRKISREDIIKSRHSNEVIVYGMGHNSIAEHAVFNIDIINISRLVVEEIESHRLCSFTEKSQRYVSFEDDFYIPDCDDDLKKQYINLIKSQFQFYKKIIQENKDIPKEDARYIIPLATYTQLGMTINARNLELMIRRLAESKLLESNELSKELYKKTHYIIPSLIKYIIPKNKNKLSQLFYNYEQHKQQLSEDDVYLEASPIQIDKTIMRAFLHSNTFLNDSQINDNDTDSAFVFDYLFKNLSKHDELPREFEVVNFSFILKTSASCYAQLKRHRMCTILPQAYDISIPNVIPPSIQNKLYNEFMNIVEETSKLYKLLPIKINNYILTNSTVRRVKLIINLRSLYHFCRLRSDKHSQWEIQNLSNKMIQKVKNQYINQNSLSMLCGRDQFDSFYKKII